MGYTRYWDRTDEPINAQFVRFVNRTIADCETRGIHICDGNGEGKPVVMMGKILLNGDGARDLDHETLYFTDDPDEVGFNFCKTARKPYDYAVRKILKGAELYGIVTNVRQDGPNDEIISDDEYDC